ncbi:MAG: rRNA maturation RNase YbeY [Planctomycetaceae bacterium]|jgi:probable rRNA maturation factor|nr:rRNA maturation RNase YbeY [Planctomycetaceae bacterium]
MTETAPLTVDIFDNQQLIKIADKNAKKKIESAMKLVCKRILADAGIGAGRVNIVLVDSPTMQQYNNRFLGHDYTTDVISFRLEYKEINSPSKQKKVCATLNRIGVGWYLDGDVYVCVDVAELGSVEYGCGVLEELFLYVVHGVLHLVGYDDTTPKSKKIMQQKESEYIATIDKKILRLCD